MFKISKSFSIIILFSPAILFVIALYFAVREPKPKGISLYRSNYYKNDPSSFIPKLPSEMAPHLRKTGIEINGRAVWTGYIDGQEIVAFE